MGAYAMTATAEPRPAAVTTLGVLYIIQGVLSLFAGTVLFLFGVTMHFAPAVPPLPSEAPPIIHSMIAHFGEAWLPGLFLLLFGLLSFVGAIALMASRAWGRATLEALTWLGVLITLAFGAWWIVNWLQLTAWAVHQPFANVPPGFNAVGLAVAGGTTLTSVIILGLFLASLRSRPVREAMLSP